MPRREEAMADWVDDFFWAEIWAEAQMREAADLIRQGLVGRGFARQIFDLTPEEEDEAFRKALEEASDVG